MHHINDDLVYKIDTLNQEIVKLDSEIESQDKNYLIKLRPKITYIDTKNIKEDFLNELIDQQLRFDLNQKNHLLREMIIKKAFFHFFNKEEDINE